MTAALQRHLSQLETAGLVRLAQLYPELEYLFRHALVQDAAYESLLKQDRKRLHLAVGEALERLYPDRLDVLAALLAHHFSEGGDEHHALHYLLRAGDHALRQYALSEAEMHFAEALRVARLDRDDHHHHLPDVFLKLGQTQKYSNQHEAALETYRDMHAEGEARADRSMQLTALIEQATLRTTSTPVHDTGQAQHLLDQALALAREMNDRRAEARILWTLLLLHKFGFKDPRTGVIYGEQSLAIAREMGDREQIAYTLNDLGSHGYADAGNIDKSTEVLLEASGLWREMGNQPMLVDSLASLSIMYHVRGDYDEALRVADEAWRIAESFQHAWGQSHSLWTVGSIHFDRGDVQQGIDTMERCVALGEAAGFTGTVFGVGTMLAMALGEIGAVDAALQNAERDLERVRQQIPAWVEWLHAVVLYLYVLKGDLERAHQLVREAWTSGWSPEENSVLMTQTFTGAALGEYYLAAGRFDLLLPLLDGMLRLYQQIRVVPIVSTLLYLKARALRAQGRDDEAYQVLCEGRDHTQRYTIRRLLWRFLADLADLEDQRGSHAEAAALRREAAGVLRYIVDHIERPSLRESFLALPHVRAVLEAVMGDE